MRCDPADHDLPCARVYPGLRAARTTWTEAAHAVLADLGYPGEADRLTCPIKKPSAPRRTGPATPPPSKPALTVEQRTTNLLPAAPQAIAERGNALPTTTFTALRRVSRCPHCIGTIAAAALVLLHTEHDRTT